MGENYKPAVGDRVRVVLEGEVDGTTAETFWMGIGEYPNCVKPTEEHVVSVEKIEPPVEVFKPGDVVRALGTGDLYALTDKGYMEIGTGRYYEDGRKFCETAFTSASYEKVSIG